MLSDVVAHQQQVNSHGVSYLNAAQRARCCVEFDNGKLHFRTYEGSTFKAPKPITSAAGGIGFGGQPQGMIWVQGPSGRFYTSADFHVGRFHHSTFLAGADVKAAGTWHIDQGFITSIEAGAGFRTTDYLDGSELDEAEKGFGLLLGKAAQVLSDLFKLELDGDLTVGKRFTQTLLEAAVSMRPAQGAVKVSHRGGASGCWLANKC